MADLSSSFNSTQPKSDGSYATSDYSSARDDTSDTDQNNKSSNRNKKEANPEFLDAVEDVHTRFVLNAPESDLESPEKLFFLLEQAWWFYEDWICDQAEDSNLPRYAQLKQFARMLFDYSPILPSTKNFNKLWNEFSQYKRKISNYGCILLNAECTHIVLCQVWNGKSWSFPSGKINQGETGVEAATRETYEETGFDPHCQSGKTRDMLASASPIPWKYPLEDQDGLSYQESQGGKRRTNFVCVGVPQDFPFDPVCRKEVSNIAWFPIDKIPKPNYAVGPFLPQLKRWIKKYNKRASGGGGKKANKKKAKKMRSGNKSRERSGNDSQYNTPRRGGTPQHGSRQGSRSKVRESDRDLIESGLADPGGVAGWSEEDMFQANEQLLGRKIEYDGNPHQFAEKGFFGGSDPHAFHVVGGSFLNSMEHGGDAISSLAPPPQTSKLQPLFRKESSAGEDEELQPFFSDEGETPWGDVVSAAKGFEVTTPARTIPAVPPPARSSNTTPAISRKLTKKDGFEATGEGIITDAEITRRSQANKSQNLTEEATAHSPIAKLAALRAAQQKQYEADMEFIHNWVAKLPKPRATPHFGEFRLDANAIVNKAMEGLQPSKVA